MAFPATSAWQVDRPRDDTRRTQPMGVGMTLRAHAHDIAQSPASGPRRRCPRRLDGDVDRVVTLRRTLRQECPYAILAVIFAVISYWKERANCGILKFGWGRGVVRVMADEGFKVVSENRKAFHDYFVEERVEAGIILTGTEIKSVRNSRVNLKDSYARIENGELWLYQLHISPYEQGNRFNHDPLRKRKLLLHRSEIVKLIGKIQLQGLTIIPIKMYLKQGLAKVEIAVCRGKKNYDKRQDMAEKDAKREIERNMRERNKY